MIKKHGQSKVGTKPTSEYSAWQSAKARCHHKDHASYKHYGARGIRVCKEWFDDFNAFFAFMGPKPPGTSLDRINNDKGYEPGNVRWATWIQQNRNRRWPRFKREDHLKWRDLRAEGWKFREIAELYGCPTGTVSTQLISLKRQGL